MTANIDDLYSTDRLRALRAGRVPLVTAPTPLQPLDRLRDALGGRGPRLWIKRDDLTGLALGGNKARKLEYLLADAREQDADVLVTVGAAQSNHARQTAAAAASVGLDSVLVLRLPVGASGLYRASGNVLLDRLFGARLVLVDETAGDPHPERAAAEAVVAELRAAGRRPYLIPSGGSTSVGALGYVDAYAEIAAADVRFGSVVLATGSGGTQAGLLVGQALLGDAVARIEAIAVSPGAEEFAGEVDALTAETLALFGRGGAGRAGAAPAHVDGGFVGPGYGVVTDEGIEAIRLFAQTEGILLDPVYTGKAAAALISGIRSGRFEDDRDILFLHTGGAPALFAHEPALTP